MCNYRGSINHGILSPFNSILGCHKIAIARNKRYYTTQLGNTHFNIDLPRSRFPLWILFLTSRSTSFFDTVTKMVAHRSIIAPLMRIEIARERKSYRHFRSGRKVRERRELFRVKRAAWVHPASDDTRLLINELHGKKTSPDTFFRGMFLIPQEPHQQAIFFGNF